MGDSLPPPAAFDLISSFARVLGNDVEIVLAEPQVELGASAVSVSLRNGRRVVMASGTFDRREAGARLVIRLPRTAVTDGTWTLSIERESAKRERIDARLLVQGQRPLVLLWGAATPHSVVPKPRKVVTRRQRAAAVAGRALDQALVVLPEERAKRVRASARGAARRIMR